MTAIAEAALAGVTAHTAPAYAGGVAPGAAPAAEVPTYYVLTLAGVLGPLTAAELTAVAETTVALTGQQVVAAQAN